MATIALMGVDGSGKTTIACLLADDGSLSLRYIYMGPNIESSNVSLPWSRLILRAKVASYRREAKRKGIEDESYLSTHHVAHRSVKHGSMVGTLRSLNRLLECTYRHLVSWIYQRRGDHVIFDRHPLFDSASASRHRLWADRVYEWIVIHLFPKPDLVLYLDAPAEVSHQRKGEGSVDGLGRRRLTYLERGKMVPRFIVVDANRSADEVLAEVRGHVLRETTTAPASRTARC